MFLIFFLKCRKIIFIIKYAYTYLKWKYEIFVFMKHYQFGLIASVFEGGFDIFLLDLSHYGVLKI